MQPKCYRYGFNSLLLKDQTEGTSLNLFGIPVIESGHVMNVVWSTDNPCIWQMFQLQSCGLSAHTGSLVEYKTGKLVHKTAPRK